MDHSNLYNMLKPLTKQEILKLSRQRCVHKHPLIAHPHCLDRYLKYGERIGFLDIETSNFDANFGVVITWCIKENGGPIFESYLQKQDFKQKSGEYDKRILKELLDTLENFDRLVVYWGKDRRFDIPFLRTRCVGMGLKFPFYQERIVNDLYDTVRNKFKFGRNSLASACTHFGIESKATPLSPRTWMDAVVGRDKNSIQLILQHNREDVISTEQLWQRIHNYSSEPKTSI